ncbi:hypothetical protein HKX48_007838 [Thoreauomyces humboldtii]|nr:hypothetical protein HKX48_007838 [Thoreauomyces humboldtii]
MDSTKHLEMLPTEGTIPSSMTLQTFTYTTPLPDVPLFVDVIASKSVLAGASESSKSRTKVILNLHGGGMVIGGRSVTSPICPKVDTSFHLGRHTVVDSSANQWLLAYTHLHNAILLSADYRLLPESSGLDLVADGQSIYNWTLNTLPTLFPSVDLDLSNIVVTGGSAGGYMATQIGIAHPETTIIAGYPMFDLEEPHYTVQATAGYWGQPPVPREGIDKFLEGLEPGKVATERVGADAMAFAAGMMQQGRLGKYLGNDERVYPRRLLDKIIASEGQRTHQKWFVFHGEDDTVVPTRESEKLVDRLGKVGAQIRYVTKPGEHGFDNALDQAAALRGDWGDSGWLKEGLDWAFGF